MNNTLACNSLSGESTAGGFSDLKLLIANYSEYVYFLWLAKSNEILKKLSWVGVLPPLPQLSVWINDLIDRFEADVLNWYFIFKCMY